MIPTIVGIISLAIFIPAVLLAIIVNATNDVDEAQVRVDQRFESVLQTPLTALSLQDFSNLWTTVNDLRSSLVYLDSRLKPFRSVMFLAGEETEIQYDDLVHARIHLANGTAQFLAGLNSSITLLQLETEAPSGAAEDTTPVVKGRQLVDMLNTSQAQFMRADEELQAALAIFEDLEQAGLSSELRLDVYNYRTFAEQVQFYNQLALESPALLTLVFGINQPHTYLILLQNNDELLPNGGRINAWGWMRMRSGRIQDQAYAPTTISSPAPPASTARAPFEVPAWWRTTYPDAIDPLWDGSLSADFSETAAMALWYYNQGDNPSQPVDGVIGIDLVALEYMLEAVEAVYVPDYSAVVDPQEFRDQVYAVRTELNPTIYHKRFLASFWTSLLDRWQQADPQMQSAVNRAVIQALRESHIKLYFADEDVQQAAEALHWAGEQPAVEGHDYLLVAEANLQPVKPSSALYRQMTYNVKIEADGTIQSSVSVFYDYPASFALQDPAFAPELYNDELDYEALLQIFTPTGSTLVSGTMSSDVNVMEQPAHTVLAGVVDVAYDDSMFMQVDYTNACELQTVGSYRAYRLFVQKQSGIRSEPIDVTVQLPPGARVVSVSPQPGSQSNLNRPILKFSLSLRQNEWIEVIYED